PYRTILADLRQPVSDSRASEWRWMDFQGYLGINETPPVRPHYRARVDIDGGSLGAKQEAAKEERGRGRDHPGPGSAEGAARRGHSGTAEIRISDGAP